MNLTDAERAILINQFDIIKLLDPQRGKDCDEKIEILQSGYKIFYDDSIAWLCDEMSEEDSRFVLDLLTMYRVLEHWYSENPEFDLADYYNAHFRGFDGNEETKHYAFATFLIEDQGRFEEQSHTDLNSHAPTLHVYAPMLAAWKAIGGSGKWGGELSADDVQKVLSAAR